MNEKLIKELDKQFIKPVDSLKFKIGSIDKTDKIECLLCKMTLTMKQYTTHRQGGKHLNNKIEFDKNEKERQEQFITRFD